LPNPSGEYRDPVAFIACDAHAAAGVSCPANEKLYDTILYGYALNAAFFSDGRFGASRPARPVGAGLTIHGLAKSVPDSIFGQALIARLSMPRTRRLSAHRKFIVDQGAKKERRSLSGAKTLLRALESEFGRHLPAGTGLRIFKTAGCGGVEWQRPGDFGPKVRNGCEKPSADPVRRKLTPVAGRIRILLYGGCPVHLDPRDLPCAGLPQFP